MEEAAHPVATEHVPFFITAPGQTDTLMVIMAVFLLAIVLLIGNLYLQLHAIPERKAHKANKVQFEIVAVLALLALFTHNNVYWVLALLLAMITIPDFSSPLATIANSLEKMADGRRRIAEPETAPAPAKAPPAEVESSAVFPQDKV